MNIDRAKGCALDPERFMEALNFFKSLHLLSEAEAAEVMAMFAPTFPFCDAMQQADTCHLHVKVEDTAALPREVIVAGGGEVENAQEGYIKFAFVGGVNVIFSSIPVAQEDLTGAEVSKPVLDHIGIDLRREEPEVLRVFEAIPGQAEALGWSLASQGGQGQGVFCCHVEVSKKYWVYPRGHATWTHPLELALGPLKVHSGKMGCDLRPMNPRDAAAAGAGTGCCGANAAGPSEPATTCR